MKGVSLPHDLPHRAAVGMLARVPLGSSISAAMASTMNVSSASDTQIAFCRLWEAR